ncbi:hypothetical protein [Burkholderia diffusa]|uniref:hypothetical protein n=1 Tax=Burkholderia diffusa TaxID=488732 RepID=UPI00157A403F|nr:hypothetical protein [Burkholderia diffusa]NTY41122.1 hypothetical protein [Burkholderia diffusa]
MAEIRRTPPWWGGQLPEQTRSFWLDNRQRSWLSRLRAAWDDDVVIQIYGGWIRLRCDEGDWRFASKAELRTAVARRRRQGQ